MSMHAAERPGSRRRELIIQCSLRMQRFRKTWSKFFDICPNMASRDGRSSPELKSFNIQKDEGIGDGAVCALFE